MAQHIGCIKQDEDGIEIEDSNLNFSKINKVLWELDPKMEAYPWLLTIAPYSDSIFNHLQTPYLIRELKTLLTKVEPELAKSVNDFIGFIQSTNSPHVYIKFIGD
jgi:hypothetical protein